MTAPATLDIQAPLSNQRPAFDDARRFKVDRKGRRSGKTRGGWICSMVGHGPGWEEFAPKWEGVLHGWDVVWLAPDYPQAKSIWREEIKPRCEYLDGVTLNNTDFVVEVEGAGRLHVRSAEAIRSLRGLGARLKGIVIDEAAWMDLESHWRDVIRPILMDNHGWALIMSTTNAGLDGNQEHRTPSFFNQLCLEIQLGRGETPEIAVEGDTLKARSPDEWVEFYGTAEDNPLISPSEFQSMVDEYPPESVSLAQEVYAKLLTAGAGVAFPEWRDDHHKQAYDPPAGWRWFAGMDWGYSSRCAVYFLAAGPGRDVLCRYEMYFQKKTPYEVGFLIGQRALTLPDRLEYVAAGSDMWDVRDGGPTLAEECQRGLRDAAGGDQAPYIVPLTSVARGSGSRAARKMLLHEHLRYETVTTSEGSKLIPPWAGAKLRVHPVCTNLLRTLPALPIHPKNTEDVDDAAEDHPYDALTYALQSRVPRPNAEEFRRVPDDIHPGFDIAKRRRRPKWTREGEDESDMRTAVLARGGFVTGVAYGRAQPSED